MLHASVVPSLPASGVTHTVSGLFSASLAETAGSASTTKEVIVVAKNVLTLYRVAAQGGVTSTQEDARVMEYVCECVLNAPPVGVQACRPVGSRSDVLACLFDEYHVSLLAFNEVTMAFDTIGLIQLDDRHCEATNRCPLQPLLRVDPTGAHVAVLSKRNDLFVFHLQRLVAVDEVLASAAAMPTATGLEGSAASTLNSENQNGATVAVKKAEEKKTVALDAWGDDDDDDDDEDKDTDAEVSAEKIEAANEESTAVPKEATAAEAATEVRVTSPPPPVTPGFQLSYPTARVVSIHCIQHITLTNVREELRNIRDLQFVESDGEPLIAFLYETYPTWAGRVKIVEWKSGTVQAKMLTCSILWTRLTGAATTNPKLLIIGDVEKLPYNITHMVPVPAFDQVPSGVLCCARNMLIHVSTKSGYGCLLNRHGEEEVEDSRTTALAFDKVVWSDAQQAESVEVAKTNFTFANAVLMHLRGNGAPSADPSLPQTLDVLAVAEDDGTCVHVRIGADGYRVTSMAATITTTGCFASCATCVAPEQYFLGSSRGDSSVVRIDSHTGAVAMVQTVVMGLCPVHHAEVMETTERRVPSDVLDESLQNSPFADLCHNVSIDPDPQLPLPAKRAVMDLALCTGWESTGALCVLRNSVRDEPIKRPDAVNSTSVFFLSPPRESTGADASRKRPRDEAEPTTPSSSTTPTTAAAATANLPGASSSSSATALPSHLVMTGTNMTDTNTTGKDMTILISVGKYMFQQVRGTALNVTVRTILAAVVPWSNAFLQVSAEEIRLTSVDGKRKYHHSALGTLLTRAQMPPPPRTGDNAQVGALPRIVSAFLVSEVEAVFVVLDNNALCCVPLSEDPKATLTILPVAHGVRAAAWWPTRRTLVSAENEDLVMRHLPLRASEAALAVESTHTYPNFAVLPASAISGVPTPSVRLRKRQDDDPLPHITELKMFDSHAPSATNPVAATLVLLSSSGELVTYNLMEKPMPRLVKAVQHLLDVRPEAEVIETIEERKERLEKERSQLESVTLKVRDTSQRLVAFAAIGGHRGVYVCGQNPGFLMLNPRTNHLEFCRHQVQSPVRGFCAFASAEVEDGYVYCTEGLVHFATMQPFGELLGHGWWMQRIALGATPRFAVYSGAAECCFVVTSTKEPFAPMRAPFDVKLRMNHTPDGPTTSTVEKPTAMPRIAATAGVPVPLNDRYEVQLLSCRDWRCLDRLRLERNEKVLDAQCVSIPRDTFMDAGPASLVAPVCVLATAFPLGEDVTTRGRCVVLATKHVEHSFQIRLLHSEPAMGPVTAVAGIQGCIAVAVAGTVRVFRYDWASKKFDTMAILYAGTYVTSLSSLREYLVYGDLHQSVTMSRFSAANRTLTVLGKDLSALSVVSSELLYHQQSFGIVATDDKRNLAIFGYTPSVEDGARPKVHESLLTLGSEYRFPSGAVVTCLRLRSLLQPAASLLYVTNYGEVGAIVPMGAQSNRTAKLVVQRLQQQMEQVAGLPSAMFLSFGHTDPVRALSGGEQIVHAPLFAQLLRLDTRARKAIVDSAFTQVSRIMSITATLDSEGSPF